MPEDKAKRQRRTTKDIFSDKIQKIDQRIKASEEKLAALKEEKNILEQKFAELENEEIQKVKEEERKKLLKFIEKNNITMDDLQSIVKK